MTHRGWRIRTIVTRGCGYTRIHHGPTLLLLGGVISGVADVHSVIGWKSRIWHALRWLAAIVVRGHSLTEARVTSTRGLIGAHGALLRYHRSTVIVVRVRVLGRNYAAIANVRHVRISEVRRHVAPEKRVNDSKRHKNFANIIYTLKEHLSLKVTALHCTALSRLSGGGHSLTAGAEMPFGATPQTSESATEIHHNRLSSLFALGV